MLKWRTILGPIPVLTLLAILISAVTTSLPKIEKGFLLEAENVLKTSGNGWANVEVDGLVLTVKGAAPIQEFKDDAIAVLGAIQGIEALRDETVLAPAEKPYIFSMRRDGKLIVLEGAVPSRSIQSQILEHIRATLPGVQLQDKTHFASGVLDSASWFKGIHYAVVQLGRLETGQLRLTDATLDIEGVTQNTEKYDTLKTALKVMPESIRIGRNSIAIMRPENYEFSAVRTGNAIMIKGFVPDENMRKSILDSVAQSISGANITDELRLAEGAPSQFSAVTLAATQFLAVANNSEVRLSKNQLQVKARPEQYEQYEVIMAILKPVTDAGISLDVSQLVVPQKNLAPLTGVFDGRIFKISGEVPDDQVKAQIDLQFQTADLKLENSIVVRSLPSKLNYAAASRHMVQAAKWSRSMSIVADESGLTVRLDAVDSVAYALASQYFAQNLGIKLASVKIMPPVVTPYTWSLQKDGSTLELTGYVPSKELRAKFLEQSRALGKTISIIDTMNFASTSLPETDFINAVQFALDLSKLLKKSAITLNDLVLSVNGQAASIDDLKAAQAMLTKLPNGVTAKTIAIEPPVSASFFWRLEKQGNMVELSGSVRHAQDYDEFNKQLAMQQISSKGTWGIDGGAPLYFQELVKQSIKALPHMSRGVIEIRGKSVMVQAEMESPLLEARFRKTISALISAKDGVRLAWDVLVKQSLQLSAAECERKVHGLLKGANSAFHQLTLEIDKQFVPVVPQIADVLSRCPQVTFDVIAAGPEKGGREFAQEIAARRARIVAADIVREGIGPQRLRIMPQGASVPVMGAQTIQLVAQTTL